MANVALMGAQWGDEGKGKIIDYLTDEADWIVRFQGGNNAGHTIEIVDEKYILHLIPSGILRPEKTCVIGNGVVVDPLALKQELLELDERGIETKGRLQVSSRAHVVFPFHRLLDEHRENTSSKASRIGTTKRGIGPSYGDKVNRIGLRMGDLLEPECKSWVLARIEDKNRMLTALGADSLDGDLVADQVLEAADFLAGYITDTVSSLHHALQQGKSLLFEGAQGTMLDIDFGTYPYVTSSNTTIGGVCVGSGVPPGSIDRVMGVIKAYTTRVGEGPFPTELNDETGLQLRDEGKEYGATTGRPRRCGWFDVPVARYAAMVNGIHSWAVTKLDVLDCLDTVKVCTAYEYKGKRFKTLPHSAHVFRQCTPIYEEFPGWKTSIKDVTEFSELPSATKAYVGQLGELTGVPVEILSVGPKRANTIRMS